jgi:lipoprotein NlpI
MRACCLCWFVAVVSAGPLAADDTAAALLAKAKQALARNHPDEALSLAGMAVARAPHEPAVYLFRGRLYEALQRHAEAVADFDAALRLDPKAAEAYQYRGAEHFKLGHIRESLADFDKYLELKPAARAGHWQRGITCYYAGKYDEGRKQFAGYEAVDTNDVENAVWHYLCNARLVGADKARAAMLKIGRDRRVPLMEVYELFRGRATPDDVLRAARAGHPPAA